MSNLRAGTLSNIAGTNSPVITGGELSRARFNFNGTGTIALRDSFNISGLTDRGTGQYTSTFTVAAPNAEYSPAYMARETGLYFAIITLPTGALRVAAADVDSINISNANADAIIVSGIIVGDIP